MFKYFEATHELVFQPRSLNIEYQTLEGLCLIDVDTATHLELVHNVSCDGPTRLADRSMG